MHEARCERCGKSIKQSVHITDDKGQNYILCRDCNNAMVAERLGINNFVDFTRNYRVKDIDGEEHVFEISKEIFFMGVQWRAVEIKNGEIEGYQFAVYAGLDDDSVEGLQKLYEKINNGLSRKYIEKKEFQGQTLYSLIDDKVAGRIEWDDQYDGRIPRLIIDGKPYTWEQLGNMLMGYEGWNFHLKIVEAGEDDE